MLINLLLYIVIIGSLIWARLRFFKVSAGTAKLSVVLYDLAVGVQILSTLYFMVRRNDVAPVAIYLCALLYLFSLLLFWWAIRTARSLDFAFSDKVGSIVTTGPFRLVRHPFYVSYMLVWIGSTLLFNSITLWITLFYLMTFYILSARKEERVILKSVYSVEYEKYIQDVGMFLPRIIKWKASSSEP